MIGELDQFVPKDFWENTFYRAAVRDRASQDLEAQDALMQACESDILFWINTFCWVFEPRVRKRDGITLPHAIPFICRDPQERAIRDIMDVNYQDDIGIEKARGEGATWIAIYVSTYEFIFHPHSTIGLVSRTEDAVDKRDDPDSLMWKVDWLLDDILPKWMVPRKNRVRSEHALKNLDNGSTIVGYAATGDVASGGRKKMFVMDELAKFPKGQDKDAMASTQHVTDSRLIISTPKGPFGEYYKVMHTKSSMRKIILDWKDNPERNRGLYRYAGGDLVEIDVAKYGELPEGYRTKFLAEIKPELIARGFVLEDTVRSPWYDHQCRRPSATPRSIAQELDRDYGGSTARFFPIDMLIRCQSEMCKPPLSRGEVTEEGMGITSTIRYTPAPDGRLKLWVPLDGLLGSPPRDSLYVVAADVCLGTGGSTSSNSTITVAKKINGLKVAEFASTTVGGEALADYAIMLCNFFVGPNGEQAFLIWEDNGCGQLFRNRVLETDFRHFYMRTATDLLNKSQKKTRPGWYTSNKTKRELLGKYSYHLAMGTFVNPSYDSLEEAKCYIWDGEKIEFVHDDILDDATCSGENHGDRVIADALANWAIYEHVYRVNRTHTAPSGPPPQNSYLYRRQMAEALRKRSRKSW